MKKLLAAVALGASTLVSANAFAVQANASFAGVLAVTGATGVPPLNAATSLTFNTTNLVTEVTSTFLGKSNDFFGEFGLGAFYTIAPSLNISAFGPVDNFLTFASTTSPANRYEFDAASLAVDVSGPSFLNITLDGSFSDTGGTYDSSPAQVLLSFQTIGDNISGSLSFGTPPFDTPIPAPGALALMGIGLMGMRLMRRKAA
jgi:hypothetical protein